VLPKAVTKRVSIEMGSTFGWERYIGSEGHAIGIDRFGASAPANTVIENYGFTVEKVVDTYKNLI
ncbi:transketolase-like TK C-terminal-containing protein, partial [Vagococcus fluvialis]|uniref:transketolase-like TK C-terminal-containing protein n=1 Tax=Vagococcus fluvialis TaxID=2738 RepID=UPI003D11D3B5